MATSVGIVERVSVLTVISSRSLGLLLLLRLSLGKLSAHLGIHHGTMQCCAGVDVRIAGEYMVARRVL
jgi:hypothetical protein